MARITDELREWAKTLTHWWYDPVKDEYTYTTGIMPPSIDAIRLDSNLTAIADRIDAAHERELAEQKDSLIVGMQPMTEENMAEGGWVRGPLDADGKMWRSGDMSDSNWGVIEGIAYEDGRWLVSGHDTSAPWIPADSIRHYHEPTVEDVLLEFTVEVWNRCCEGATASDSGIDGLVAEYAAKLRLADDGEGQQ